jgi:hypothetical protein
MWYFWLKSALQFGPNVPVHFHDDFAMRQTAMFMVIHSKLHYGGISVLFSENACLRFGLIRAYSWYTVPLNTVWILFD